MAKPSTCHYHAQAPATWQCCQCQRLYCDQCVPRPPESMAVTRCSICSGELVFQGAANTATPFWHRIQTFFSYPFHNSVLLFLVAMTLFGLTLNVGGLLSLLLVLIYAGVYTKYLFRIIELNSLGRFEPPAFSEAFSGDGFSLFFKQVGVLLVASICIVAAGKSESTLIVLLVSLLISLALPASIMILAQEQSLAEAINPGKISFVIQAIGWPYLILCGFLMILYNGLGWVQYQIATSLYGPFIYLAGMLANGYFMVVMAAMMGYCLYQYQQPLGYATEDEREASPDLPSYQKQLALAESHIFVKEGRLEEAISAVRKALNQGQENDPELNQRLHRLLLNSSDSALLKRHSNHYLQLLVDQGNSFQAGQIFTAVRSKLSDFLPAAAPLRLRLADALFRQGRHREAVVLLQNFHRTFSGHPQIAEAYLLAARVLSEGLGRDDQARALLTFVLRHYPEHPRAAEARTLMSTLQRLATPTNR